MGLDKLSLRSYNLPALIYSPQVQMLRSFFFSLLILCSSCDRSPQGQLRLREQIITKRDLASVHVHTPDPLHEQGFSKRTLFIDWKMPKKAPQTGSELLLHIIFLNLEKKSKSWTLKGSSGQVSYPLENVASYEVFLLSEGKLIDRWLHQLSQESS